MSVRVGVHEALSQVTFSENDDQNREGPQECYYGMVASQAHGQRRHCVLVLALNGISSHVFTLQE